MEAFKKCFLKYLKTFIKLKIVYENPDFELQISKVILFFTSNQNFDKPKNF